MPVKMAASDYEPHICAIDVEVELFNANKVANLYKAAVIKKVSEIKKHTKDKDLHPTLMPKFYSTFTKASALLGQGQEDDIQGQGHSSLTTASTLLSDGQEDEHKGQGHSSFTIASALLSQDHYESDTDLLGQGHSKGQDDDLFNDNDLVCAAEELDRAPERFTQKQPVSKIKYFFENKMTEENEVEKCENEGQSLEDKNNFDIPQVSTWTDTKGDDKIDLHTCSADTSECMAETDVHSATTQPCTTGQTSRPSILKKLPPKITYFFENHNQSPR